jgi:hypothetical protein
VCTGGALQDQELMPKGKDLGLNRSRLRNPCRIEQSSKGMIANKRLQTIVPAVQIQLAQREGSF